MPKHVKKKAVPVPSTKVPPRPNRTGKALTVWLDRAVFDRMEQFRAAQKFKPTKTEVIELALQEFFDRDDKEAVKE